MYSGILIDDNLQDLQSNPEYFIKNQQNTHLNIKDLTNDIFEQVFEIIDNGAF